MFLTTPPGFAQAIAFPQPTELAEELFLFRLQPLPDAFARFRGKGPLRKSPFLAGAVAGCGSQEANLLSVATAPLAEQQVDFQTEPLAKGKFVIQGGGLQVDGMFAAGR